MRELADVRRGGTEDVRAVRSVELERRTLLRASASASVDMVGLTTRTHARANWRTNSSTLASVISLPRPMMMRRSAISAISESWCERRTRCDPRGEMSEELADPADAFWVEPVRGLVEEQHPRVAEHGGGDAEALLHAQRVAPARFLATAPRPTSSSTSSTRVRGKPFDAARPRRWLRAGAPGVQVAGVEQRADLVHRTGQVAVGPAVERGRSCRGRSNPSSRRIVVLLPDPFGPRKPVTCPGCTSKLRLSTATSAPNRLTSPPRLDHSIER